MNIARIITPYALANTKIGFLTVTIPKVKVGEKHCMDVRGVCSEVVVVCRVAVWAGMYTGQVCVADASCFAGSIQADGPLYA